MREKKSKRYKKSVKFLIFLLVIISFLSVSLVSAVSSYSSCDDSDSGLNYNLKGTVKGNEKNILGTKEAEKTDDCFSDRVLTEYYCKNDFVKSVKYKCLDNYECGDGECILEIKEKAEEKGVLHNVREFLSFAWLIKLFKVEQPVVQAPVENLSNCEDLAVQDPNVTYGCDYDTCCGPKSGPFLSPNGNVYYTCSSSPGGVGPYFEANDIYSENCWWNNLRTGESGTCYKRTKTCNIGCMQMGFPSYYAKCVECGDGITDNLAGEDCDPGKTCGNFDGSSNGVKCDSDEICKYYGDGLCSVRRTNTCWSNCKSRGCGDNIKELDGPDGIPGNFDDEQCDAGKFCIYDPALPSFNKKKCSNSKDCDIFNINEIKCNACATIDTPQCTKDCKCIGMYFKEPEKTCAINESKVYFVINKQGYWERDFTNNICSISDYSEITLNSEECSYCEKCSLDYPYKQLILNKEEESFVYFDIYNPFEIPVNPKVELEGSGSLFVGLDDENVIIPSKTNKIIKFKVTGYNCGKFKTKVSVNLLNYNYEMYVYANVKCGECKYDYNTNEFNIEPACYMDSEKEGKECDSPKLRTMSKIDSSTLYNKYPSSVFKYCEEKKEKGICYYGECVFECEDVQNEEDFERLTGIDLKYYNNKDIKCLQDICRAVKSFPKSAQKKFSFYLLINPSASHEGYSYAFFGTMQIKSPGPSDCFNTFKHEASHFLNWYEYKTEFSETWPSIRGGFEFVDVGYYNDSNGNSKYGYYWKTRPPDGPRYGFANPYGSTMWREDIANFAEVVISDPKSIGLAMTPGNSYAGTYKKKLDYLYEHGYISCEDYHSVLIYAGIEK